MSNSSNAPKFTQGQWRIIDDDEICSGNVVVAVAYSTDNYMSHPEHEIDGEESELPSHKEGVANAHLIAAAPEMYKALKLALKQIENYGGDGLASGIDAAIAKAEGKSL